jgi:hypothetical protein
MARSEEQRRRETDLLPSVKRIPKSLSHQANMNKMHSEHFKTLSKYDIFFSKKKKKHAVWTEIPSLRCGPHRDWPLDKLVVGQEEEVPTQEHFSKKKIRFVRGYLQSSTYPFPVYLNKIFERKKTIKTCKSS